MPAKKEYYENIIVKQNQTSRSLIVHQIQVITLLPLKLLSHFLITILMLEMEGENKVGHIISETANSIKGIDLQMLFEE